MQISQNLKLKQSQTLVMTPQLQQAIKLLQLNNIELCQLVDKELEENPFLESDIETSEDEKVSESTESIIEAFESGESLSDTPSSDESEKQKLIESAA
tara:strand:+ start:312 stop:605 length:294 start_codon:yes stop_codon:yes gene_type:complete